MTIFLGVCLLFTIWMALAARRRKQYDWAWIVVIFTPLGAVYYFATQYLRRGSAPAKVGGSRVAVESLRQAEADAARVDNASTWCDLAAELRRHGRFADAEAAARTALERDPASVESQFELGMSLQAAGKSAAALAPLRGVVEVDPGHRAGEAMHALGQALSAAGDLPGALLAFERLTARSSRTEYLYALGSIQLRLGNREAARATLERLLAEVVEAPSYYRREMEPWVVRARQDLVRLH